MTVAGDGSRSAPSTACVVVNFASTDLVEPNVAPLERTSTVVVVDNFSSRSERDRITRVGSARGWRLVLLPTNAGFGAGANAGVAEAFRLGAEVVCLLNPDATIDHRDLARLSGLAAADPRAFFAPRIVTDDGRDWFTGAGLDVRHGRTTSARMEAGAPVTHPWLTGACLVFHREAWAIAGGFDDDYFMYWEDVDLSWRHSAAGGRLRYVPEVTVQHAVSATQRDDHRLGRSSLYYYYNCRNRLLFAAKNLDRAAQVRWAVGTLRYAYEVMLRGGRRQFLQPWRPLRAALGGSCTGLMALLRKI